MHITSPLQYNVGNLPKTDFMMKEIVRSYFFDPCLDIFVSLGAYLCTQWNVVRILAHAYSTMGCALPPTL